MRRLTHWREHGIGLLVAVLLSLTAGTQAAYSQQQAGNQAQAQQAQAQPQASVEPGQLPELAESGRFDELLDRLKDDYAGQDDAAVQSLIDDLERYHEHREADARARREAYEQATTDAREALDDEQIESALISAIEAHGLADDPQAMLEQPLTQSLVKQAEAAAEQAKAEHSWVEALTLYRLLDLLYEQEGTYQEAVEQANRHVRVLRIYAPKKLRELYEQQEAAANAAADDGEEGDDQNPGEVSPPPVDTESWEERLKDVEMGMLQRAVRDAAREHIGEPGYLPLVRGAVEGVDVLINTKALSNTFPAYKNEQALGRFRAELAKLSKKLQQREGEMSFLRAATILDQITVINEQTLDLPERVLVYEMAEGAIGSLDRFSGVVWPRQIDTLQRSMSGKFSGVGIKISRENGRLTVESPLPGTPAYRAGLKADDIIAEVDGVDTATWSLDTAVRHITGEEGTVVTLGIKRQGEPDLIEYDIRRAEIRIESVLGWQHTDGGDWDYFIDSTNRIGYVRLSQFLPQTASDLDAAVEKMQKSGDVNGLILDLRFNPGGLLDAAVDVADRFVKQGPIVFNVDGNGKRVDESRQPPAAAPQHTYKPFPVVVLINQGSASASEIVSGALQDYDRAVIVGTRSFGKGSVQELYWLRGNNALLKLTTQHYMLPQGRIIHRQPHDKTWGIEPDLAVDMTDEQAADAIDFRRQVDVIRDAGDAEKANQPTANQILSKGLDPQLEVALLVLKTRLAAHQIASAQISQRQQASSK